MKIFFYSVIILFISSANLNAQTGTRIKMKIDALKGQYTELWTYYGKETIFIDSIRFGENGLANYYNKKGLLEGVYRVVLPNTNSFELIVSEPKIFLHTDLITPYKSMTIKKSEENKIYYEYRKYILSQRTITNNLISQHKEGTLSTNDFSNQMKIENQKIKQYKLNLIAQHDGKLVADLLKAGMNPEIDTTSKEPYADYLNKYLNQINYKNTALLRSPVLDTRTVEYVDLLVAPFPQEKIKAIDNIFSQCNKEIKTYLIERFIEKYEGLQTVGYDEIFSHLVKNYLEETNYSNKRKNILREKETAISFFLRGNAFKIKGIEERELIDSIKAKYTLVIIWDERLSTKQLELLYDFSQSYAPYDLKVLAITLANDFSKLNIGQEKKWTNLKGDQSLRKELMMDDALMLILLDKDKKVLARDISLDFLVDTIDAWEK
jgi:hypothetical protein